MGNGDLVIVREAFALVSCSRAGRRRGARDEKRPRGRFVDRRRRGGGGEGWDARWGRTAPRRARARAGARAARAAGRWRRARARARRGGAKRVVMTGHWLGATGQPARGWEEKSRVARATHLAEAAKAVRVDGGLMDEDLVGAVVGGDEPEALLRVEPLHLREPGRSRGASTNRRTLLLVFFPSPRIARPARGGREATGSGPATAPRDAHLAGEFRHRFEGAGRY